MPEKPNPKTGHMQAKSTMRTLGPILIAIGVILSIIGIGDFFITFITVSSGNANPSDTRFPTLFLLAFPGFFFIGIGSMLTKTGYLKEITQYAAKETSPAITTTVTAVRAAITDDDIPCPSCASPIEPNSKFCSSCGTQTTELQCSLCNTTIEPNDKFCNSCGTEISYTKSA